jgi:ABC-2 type transport system ATP-binding protein
MASLEAVELSKSFGTFVALRGAKFSYEGSGAIGYLGPNGAGKTTTLKLFTHLLRPSSGSARINGIDVSDDPKRALWDVGSVIETPEPYPSQSVREALDMVGAFRGLAPREIAAQIERLHDALELPPLDRRTGKLSKGQRQRVVIAGAMLSDPGVLLLDEPTSGLDPAERVTIRNLLNELKRERLILMSSHLLAEVTEICDRVIFINRGEIVLQDTVAALGERFRVTKVDVEFLAPVPNERWSELGTLVRSVVPLGERRYRLEFDGRDAARAELLEHLLRLGRVLSFASSSLTLEDAYLSLLAPPEPPGAGLPPPPPPPPTSPPGRP